MKPNTGKLFESLLEILQLIQWKRERLFISSLSVCVWTNSAVDNPTGQKNHEQTPS
jgi:hypothetical protein